MEHFGQYLATAIVDPTARPGEREAAEAVVFSEVPPLSPVHELEISEAEVKKAECGEDQQKEKCCTATQRTDVLSQFHDIHRSLRT